MTLRRTQDRALRFAGYAALFGLPDGARDTILPGAFSRTLAHRKDLLPLFGSIAQTNHWELSNASLKTRADCGSSPGSTIQKGAPPPCSGAAP